MSSSALDGVLRDGRHVMSARVYYEDTDFSGAVYHASYLRFMERGRTNYLRLLGVGRRALFEETEKEAPGFAFVVRSMRIEFLKAARMDDLLEIISGGLAAKFGAAGKKLAARVRKCRDIARLKAINRALITAKSIKEVENALV